MIKNIIFDIGQVLAGFDWQDYLRRFQFDRETEKIVAKAVFQTQDWFDMDYGLHTSEEYLAKMISNAPEYEKEIRMVYEHSPECITKREYAIPWVKQLKQEGYRVYYLSNYPERVWHGSQDALEFTKYMHGGIFSFRVHVVKPDPAIFQCLMKQYPEIKPEESIFFDDTAVNVESASDLGFHAVIFKNKEQAENAIHRIIESENC